MTIPHGESQMKYRMVLRDDIQTHSPDYAYSRGTPFSIESPTIFPNENLKHNLMFMNAKVSNEKEIETYE